MVAQQLLPELGTPHLCCRSMIYTELYNTNKERRQQNLVNLTILLYNSDAVTAAVCGSAQMHSYAHLQMRLRELQNIIVAFGGLPMNSAHVQCN